MVERKANDGMTAVRVFDEELVVKSVLLQELGSQDYLGMFGSWSPPKHIEIDVKPVVDLLVNCMIFGTQSGWI